MTIGASRDRPLPFERFSAQEGLSQSIVECILIDCKGFLWLGTEDGLNRFDGYGFRVFRHSMDEPRSLSYSEVKCLAADGSGTIWAGTFGGLNRFEPATETFDRFTHDPEDSGSLSCDVVRAIASDRSGGLWVGTERGGLNRLDPTTGKFEHYRHDPKDPESLSHDNVQTLVATDDGGLWIGTAGGGLNRLEPRSRSFLHLRHDPLDSESLTSDQVTALFQDREGRLWVGTDLGLHRFEPGARRCERIGSGPDGLADLRVTDICEDPEGRLWIGTDGGGADRLDPETRTIVHHRHDPDEESSLSTDRVFSCRVDGSGGVWIGTYGGGVHRGDPRRARFAHFRFHQRKPDGLCHPIVWSIQEDNDGALWVGTDGGLDRIDRSTREVTHFLARPDDPDGLAHPAVRVVYEGPTGTLWLGTNGGVQRLDRATGSFERFVHDDSDAASLSHDEIRCFLEEPSGELWVGTLGGGLNLLDPAAGACRCFRHDPGSAGSLCSDFVRAIHVDRQGRMWIGTQGGGLDLFDPGTGRCEHFRHDPDDSRTLSSDYVFSIWEDDRGLLWLGSYAGGLDRFDPSSGHTKRYGTADGLPANLVYAVVGDEHGRIWASTNKGLTRFDPVKEQFRNYDWRDGLQADEFNGASYHRSRSGELFFGGVDGFNAFYPGELEDSRFEPRVELTDFQLMGESLTPGQSVAGRIPLRRGLQVADEIRLTYRDRVFSFQFAALDYSNPRKIRYAFRLTGFDRKWRHGSSSHRWATYTNVPPGRYRFEVRATNSDGIWSPHRASVRLTISPPVWGTWWFRGLAGSLATGLAVHSYRRRVATVRLAAELDAAKQAQRSIWPQGDPHLPGFEIAAASRPASEVGGDFFDYLWLDPDRTELCIAVGDVAGKGMRAAMTAVLSSGMIAAQLQESPSLERAMAQVNRLTRERSTSGSFTALCLASIDASDGIVRYVNAGMPEPLLRSRTGVRFLETPEPRFPLGIHPADAYRQRTEQLAAGDILVIYSDGAPEAQSRAGEVYGYEALRASLEALDAESLSVTDVLHALLAGVDGFAEHTPPQDDTTVIVVKADESFEPAEAPARRPDRRDDLRPSE